MKAPRVRGVGWLIVVVGVAVLYFIFKKSSMVGGVTATSSSPYGKGTTGLYSQVG